MKSKKSVLIALSLTGVALPLSISLPIVLTTTVNNKIIDNDYYYLYNGQYYDSIDNATDDAIINKKAISSDIYVGNITDSIFDQEFKRLDINRLRAYDRDKLYPAFKNSLGQYEPNYEAAKKSFVNNGLIQYLYDDFRGNIFNSENEALNSMRNAVFKTPLAYHTLSLANHQDKNFEFNFNPLNPTDVTQFKHAVFKNLKNTNNGLDLKVYDLVTSNKADIVSDVAYSSANLSDLYDENFTKNFADEISLVYLNTKNDFINNNDEYGNPYMTWNVNVKMTGQNIKNTYEFQELNRRSWGHSVNISQANPRTLLFSNVKTEDLNIFDSFLSRNIMENNFNMEEKLWGILQARVATLASPKENAKGFLSDWHFLINYVGPSHGGHGGVDYDILKEGTDPIKPMLTFAVHPQISGNLDILKNKFSDLLSTRVKNFINNKYADNDINSFMYKYASTYATTIKDFMWEKENNYFDNSRFSTKDKLNTMRDQQMISPTPFTDEYFVRNASVLWDPKNNEQFKDWKLINNLFGEKGTLEISKNEIESRILKNNKLKFLIEYNNNPLFEIPFETYMTYRKMGKPALPINKNDFFADNAQEKEFEIVNSFKNVSNNFLTHKIEGKDYHNYLPYNLIQNKYTYNSLKQDDRGLFIHEALDYEPSINNKDFNYELNTALWAYNKSLNNIYETNSNSLPNFSKKDMIEINDVISLYNNPVEIDNQKTSSRLKFYYSEYLAISNTFNADLINQNNLVLFNSEDEINKSIANNALLKPTKVIVLYDLLGNVINPGVKLSEDEKLSTTNDAVYDSQSSIIDNLLRTKIIRNDPTKVFHYDNEKYTLLDNIKDIVYTLNWENRNYYFPTFKDARNYAYEFIKTQVIRVPR